MEFPAHFKNRRSLTERCLFLICGPFKLVNLLKTRKAGLKIDEI